MLKRSFGIAIAVILIASALCLSLCFTSCEYGDMPFEDQTGDTSSSDTSSSDPAYSPLDLEIDTNRKMNIYVCQFAKDHYSFSPSNCAERLPQSDIESLPDLDIDDMRIIIKSCSLGKNNVNIIPWQDIDSSYISECFIDPSPEKTQDYTDGVISLLFDNSGSYETLIDSARHDIDGDNKAENIIITEYGENIKIFLVKDYLIKCIAEYENTYESIEFFENEGALTISAINADNRYMSYRVLFTDDRLTLTSAAHSGGSITIWEPVNYLSYDGNNQTQSSYILDPSNAELLGDLTVCDIDGDGVDELIAANNASNVFTSLCVQHNIHIKITESDGTEYTGYFEINGLNAVKHMLYDSNSGLLLGVFSMAGENADLFYKIQIDNNTHTLSIARPGETLIGKTECRCDDDERMIYWIQNTVTTWIFYDKPTASGETAVISTSYGQSHKAAKAALYALNSAEWTRARGDEGFIFDGIADCGGQLIYFGLDQKIIYTDGYFASLTDEHVNAFLDVRNQSSPIKRNLRESYPQFYGLDTSEGVAIYVSQRSPSSYRLSLICGNDRPNGWQELDKLTVVGAEAMREILSSYKLSADETEIVPYQDGLSSYIPDYFLIGRDDIKKEYIENIKKMLFEEKNDLSEEYSLDIDGDGNIETVIISRVLGSSAGTFTIIVKSGETIKYRNQFLSGKRQFTPMEINGKIKLVGKPSSGRELIYICDIAFIDGSIELTYSENSTLFKIPHFGKQ